MLYGIFVVRRASVCYSRPNHKYKKNAKIELGMESLTGRGRTNGVCVFCAKWVMISKWVAKVHAHLTSRNFNTKYSIIPTFFSCIPVHLACNRRCLRKAFLWHQICNKHAFHANIFSIFFDSSLHFLQINGPKRRENPFIIFRRVSLRQWRSKWSLFWWCVNSLWLKCSARKN